MTNLNQIRAKNAFEAARQAAGQDYRKDFLGIARNLPSMFQTNGLLATWAFHLSKDSRAQNAILLAVLNHFKNEHLKLVSVGTNPMDAFSVEWTGGSPIGNTKFREITAEAITFSGWLKRAAEALCDQ